MARKRYFTPKKVLAASLAVFGLALWLAAVLLHGSPASARDVNFSHFQMRLLAVVVGGAAVTGGVLLIVAR